MRWERDPKTGRQRLVAGDPTPAEAAAGAARMKEICDSRQPPAADIWNPESTILSFGHEVPNRAAYKDEMKRRGVVEVSQGEISRLAKKNRPTMKELAKSAVEEAREFLQRTGQYVDPSMPTTDKTKDRIIRGLPVLDRMPEDDPEPLVQAASEADLEAAIEASPEPLEPVRVDTPSRPGLPWGYVGDKEDFRAAGIQAAIQRKSAGENGPHEV